MNFSNRLKELRQHNKISQQELADLLGISTRLGVSTNQATGNLISMDLSSLLTSLMFPLII
jgi:transcriptional regulator with XRE-family HTH domain